MCFFFCGEKMRLLLFEASFFCWGHLALEWRAGALQFCRVVHFKFNTIILDLWSGHFCFAVWVNELCSISARRVLFHVGLYMSCSSLLPFPQSTKVRKLSWSYKTCTCTLRCHVGSPEGPRKLIAFYHFYILFCGSEVICQQWPCCLCDRFYFLMTCLNCMPLAECYKMTVICPSHCQT